MADPQIVTTLRAKQAELQDLVAFYDAKADEARVDLAHVNAVLRLYETGDAPQQFPVHMNMHRLFKRGDLWKLAKQALEAAQGPMTTREIAAYVIQAKGLDARDKALRKAITYKLVQALTMQWKRGAVASAGKWRGVRAWEYPPSPCLNVV